MADDGDGDEKGWRLCRGKRRTVEEGYGTMGERTGKRRGAEGEQGNFGENWTGMIWQGRGKMHA